MIIINNGGGGSSGSTRGNVVFTSGVINPGSFETGSFTLGKGFVIIAVSVDRSSRIRLYATAAQRDADIARGTFSPPAVNTSHGVIMDMVLNGSALAPLSNFICSPEIVGANADGPAASLVYYTITNNTTSASTVQLTLSARIEE